MSTHCRRNDIVLDLSWDSFSGFSISTDSDKGDDLVKEIGIFLDNIIGGQEFEKYIRDK